MKRGLTLVEVLLSLGVIAIVVAGIMGVMGRQMWNAGYLSEREELTGYIGHINAYVQGLSMSQVEALGNGQTVYFNTKGDRVSISNEAGGVWVRFQENGLLNGKVREQGIGLDVAMGLVGGREELKFAVVKNR